MLKFHTLLGALAACGMLSAALPAAFAQNADSTAKPAAKSKPAAGGQKSDREGIAEEVDPAANRKLTDEEREEAVEHFLAGYYAGYTDGYLDGADDLVIEVVEAQHGKAEKHMAQGHHPEKMQPGRRNVRETMRGHMQGGNPGDHAAGHDGAKGANPQRGPTATVAGKVIGMKMVPITNTKIEHRVVRLQTEDGNRRVADLGPKDQTDKLDIKEGDDLKVQGAYVMAGDMQIVAAREVTKGDKSANVMYEDLRPDFKDVKGKEIPGDRGGAGVKDKDSGR